MGLDTTHDCFSAAYSTFGVWRNKLAEAAGCHAAKVQHPEMVIPYDLPNSG